MNEATRAGVTLVPENAPFDEEQRAWLNGFLAGVLGFAANEAELAAQNGARTSGRSSSLPERTPSASESERERHLLAALARLDCGKCGYSCEGYARALTLGTERDIGLCAPGGAVTREALAAILHEPARLVRGGRSASGIVRAARLEPEAKRALTSASSDERARAERLHVKSQRRVTLADAGSEVREVILDLSGTHLSYETGDTLAVFAHNDPELVRALLRALGARGQEIVTGADGGLEVWRCLLEQVDITHVRPETLRLFANSAVETEAVHGLAELSERGAPGGFDLLDLLGMFPSVRPGLDQVIATLGAIEQRLYAIASSPSLYPGEIHLAVRMVRREHTNRERKGVASTFLTEGLIRGDDVSACVRRATPALQALISQPDTPLILLGAGTGIARHRALLQQLEARGRRGNTWLILVSCNEGDEALYEAELKTWLKLGVLEYLDVIKVGQRGRRLGPHDILRRRSRRVASWLDHGAFVHACGESRGFSGSLSDTLIELLGRQGRISANDAAGLLNGLRREGRLIEEVY